MLSTLKDLFDSFAAPAARQTPAQQQHAAQLATAVLLVEVMRADPAIGTAERLAVVQALRSKFSLADDELDRLLELAQAQASALYDYHQFTSTINDHFAHPQKVQMIEAMWRVAYADAHLDTHENHVISKVAGLLHVTHGEYIAAKLHARDAIAPQV